MKKLLSLVITLTVLLSCITPVRADSEITVMLNGAKIVFDQPPIIQNGRTLVPMRKIFEAMDCEVEWDDEGIINIWKNGENIMFLRIGVYGMWTPSRTVELDVPPIIVNDRTLVPVRAISESMGADVEWDGDTRTVNIYYFENSQNNQSNCSHTNTKDVTMIDAREYEDTGSPSFHKVIDEIAVYCNDCGEQTDTKYKETEKPHNFEGNVCSDCGYKKSTESNDSYTKPSTPISSGSVSDYIDGAFMYITVPSGKNIKIPNTSNGNLKIQMDGVYNSMECRENGTFTVGAYNEKDKKGSISIAKNSDTVIQNSGYDDLIVSIPAEYAKYQETSEKVYDILYLNEWDNAAIKAINNQGINVYFSNKKFEYIEYTAKKLNYSSTQSTLSSCSLTKIDTMLITAKGNMEIHYCPATTSCQTTSQTAFEEYTINSGDTIRIYSDDESSTNIHTDGQHTYDYVIYGTDGKVKGQKQNYKSNKTAISKKCYMDFTNTSASSITIKVPSVYCNVEE